MRPHLALALCGLALAGCPGSSTTPDAGGSALCGDRTCAVGQRCEEGLCVFDCGASFCRGGQVCGSDGCYPDACAQAVCAVGAGCQNGACRVASCLGVTCPLGSICTLQGCLPTRCAGAECPAGSVCETLACVDRSCEGLECPAGQACHHAACCPESGCADAGPVIDAGCQDPTCVCYSPDSRACYPYGTGVADPTVGVGRCHLGAQSCGGDGGASTWGACKAAVVPGPELCNGLDDDCDGTKDEGCPTGFTFDAGAVSPEYATGTGGSPYTIGCAAGQVARGAAVTWYPGFWDYSVTLLCGTPVFKLVDAGSPTAVYELSVSAGANSATTGSPGSASGSFTCPNGHVVTGIFGKQSTAIVSLGLRCSAYSAAGNAFSFAVTRTAAGSSNALGQDAGSQYGFDCPGAQMVGGLFGHSGAWIDRMGGLCLKPTLQLSQ